MSLLKRLISDTAVYGTSSIMARGLNYLLTFLIASLIPTREFGVFTDLYAMAGFMLVLLTHGMETSYFRHVNLLKKDKPIFDAAFSSVAAVTALFLLLTLGFSRPIASLLKYPDQAVYVSVFAFIIFFDVLSAVPFARLRNLGRAKTFAAIRIFNVVLTILLNVFFLLVCPRLIADGAGPGWLSWYDPSDKVFYVFLSNLVASAITFLLLSPALRNIRFKVDPALYRRMLRYALPVMVIGFAGVINEMFDRKALRFLLPFDDAENLRQVGIYGFAYKLSMIMTLFLQAYRYAVEPILFSEAGRKDAPKTYATVMNYYLLAAVGLFGLILFNLPLLEFLLFETLDFNLDYKASFAVVPVLLAANGFLGIYFNIATWYKVTDRTLFGAGIALGGAAITIALNFIWVPVYGFAGSAWATLICYVLMTIAGLVAGQRIYPIPYRYGRLISYLVAGLGGFLLFRSVGAVPWYIFSVISVFWVIGAAVLLRRTGPSAD